MTSNLMSDWTILRDLTLDSDEQFRLGLHRMTEDQQMEAVLKSVSDLMIRVDELETEIEKLEDTAYYSNEGCECNCSACEECSWK